MKQLLILSLLCSFSFNLFADNWDLFPKGQSTIYKMEMEDQVYIKQYNLDSTYFEGKRVYTYRDTIAKNARYSYDGMVYERIEECLSTPPYDNSIILNCQFFTRKNDSLVFYKPDIIDVLPFREAFVFKPFVEVGGSWKIDGKEIKCTQKYWGEFLGIEDSIKHFLAGDSEFLLSKKYGLIKFLPLDNLAGPYYYELFSIKKGDFQAGYQRPVFKDYFPLQKGDVKFWKDIYYVADYTKVDYYRKDSITAVSASSDTISYKLIRWHYDTQYNLRFQEDVTIFYTKQKEGVIIEAAPSTINHASWKYDDDYKELFINEQFFKKSDKDIIWYCNYTGSVALKYYSDHSITFWWDYSPSQDRFSTKHGVEYKYIPIGEWEEANMNEPRLHQSELIGSRINGLQTGITEFIPTRVSEVDINLKVVPNPATHQVQISVDGLKIQQIEIYSVTGSLLLENRDQESITIDQLEAGSYLIKVYAESGKIFQKKLMKIN